MEPSSFISDLLNLANTIVIVDGDVKESLVEMLLARRLSLIFHLKTL